MGSHSIHKVVTSGVEKARFLTVAAKNQAAVLSDFHLKTNYSKPFMVLIEPTLRCPMGCKFCDLPTDTTYPKKHELPLERWKEILRELQEFSPLIRNVYISGGEPFLRQDLIDLIEYAHSIGIGTRTLTVGAFCDQKLLDRLLKSPMEYLRFSLHSAEREIHNGLVGRKVFDKTISAIQYLRSHGYTNKLGILTTVWQGNVDKLGDIARLAKDIGLDSVLFRPLFGQTKAKRVFDELPNNYVEYHPECVVQDLSVMRKSIEELKVLRRQGLPIANTDEQLDIIVRQAEGTFQGLPGCHLMYESMYIKPNGNVEVCGHMTLGVMGNVAHKNVSEVLSSKEAYKARHCVSRTCTCQGNAFVRKSFSQKIAVIQDLLRGD